MRFLIGVHLCAVVSFRCDEQVGHKTFQSKGKARDIADVVRFQNCSADRRFMLVGLSNVNICLRIGDVLFWFLPFLAVLWCPTGEQDAVRFFVEGVLLRELS